MRDRLHLIALPALALALPGCVSTATSIVKAPFRATGQVIDWTTTSQSESDRNYGKKMRKREAEEGRRLRDEEKQRREACRRDDRDDC